MVPAPALLLVASMLLQPAAAADFSSERGLAISGGVILAFSGIALALGVLELLKVVASCHCHSFAGLCILALVMQGPVLGLAAWLLHLKPASTHLIALVIISTLMIIAHAAVLAVYWKRYSGRQQQLANQKQQLLTRNNTGTGALEEQLRASLALPERHINPLTLSAGIIPGTSQWGYVVFLPSDAQAPADQSQWAKQAPSTPAMAKQGSKGSSPGSLDTQQQQGGKKPPPIRSITPLGWGGNA